jgi:hypothetical protein
MTDEHELLRYLRRWVNARVLTSWRVRAWDFGWGLGLQLAIGALHGELSRDTIAFDVSSPKLAAQVERDRERLIEALVRDRLGELPFLEDV